MNTYPLYKDSGVEWIGEVPGEWNVKRLDHFFTERKDKVDDVSYPPLSVTMKGIKDQLEGVAKSDDSSNRKLVLKSDFVINSRSDRKGSSGISFRDGSVSLINTVLEPKNIEPNYVNYLFKSYYFIEEYFRFGKGIHFDLWSTNYSVMKNIKIPVLSIEEQQQISDYLDYKTSKIDILIEKTEQKIELLKEQRSSLINTTVTKGLNSDVEMKDSGIEWIGETPIGWNITRLINLGVFSKGKGIVKDDIKTEGHPCVRGGEVYTQYDRIFNKTVSYISDETVDKSILFKYKSILFAGDGETLEDIGKCIVYNGSEDIYIGGGINVFTPIDTVNHIFLSYLLNSDYVVFQKSREGRGQIIVHIYQKQLREIRLSIPPHQEQQQIVDYLDSETSKIDKLVDIESKRIILLKEYRQSLISEVVTGKVDIRDEVLM